MVAELLDTPTDEWTAEIPEYDFVAQNSLDKKNESSRTESKPGSRRWLRWLVAAVALGLLGWAGFLFSPQIIRIATNQGEIIIDTKVDDVEIEVMQGGQIIKLIDTKTNQSIDIKAGEYQLRPVGDNNSISIDKETLTLKRGDQVIVKVTNRVNPQLPNGLGVRSAPVSDASKQFDQIYAEQVKEFLEASKPKGPHRIAAGDVLAIYIDGILATDGNEKPLIQTEAGPVIGYPINVNEHGDIKLPHIEKLNIAGKTASELEDLLHSTYTTGKEPILKSDAFIAVSFIRSRFRTADQTATAPTTAISQGGSRLPLPHHTKAPRYKGKTLAEWRVILRTERDMSNLTQAVRGAMMLGGKAMPADLRNEVVDTFRIAFTAEGVSPTSFWRSNCFRFLSSLSFKNLYEATQRELESGNRNSLPIVERFFLYDFDEFAEEYKQTLEPSDLRRSKQFINTLIATENDRHHHYPFVLSVAHSLDLELEPDWIENTFDKYFEHCKSRPRYYMVKALEESNPRHLAKKLSESMAKMQELDFHGFSIYRSPGTAQIDLTVQLNKPYWGKRDDESVNISVALFKYLDSPNFGAEDKRTVLKAYLKLWKSLKPSLVSKKRIAQDYMKSEEVKRQETHLLLQQVLSMKLGAKKLMDEVAAKQMIEHWDEEKVVMAIAEAYANGERIQFAPDQEPEAEDKK